MTTQTKRLLTKEEIALALGVEYSYLIQDLMPTLEHIRIAQDAKTALLVAQEIFEEIEDHDFCYDRYGNPILNLDFKAANGSQYIVSWWQELKDKSFQH